MHEGKREERYEREGVIKVMRAFSHSSDPCFNLLWSTSFPFAQDIIKKMYYQSISNP